MTDFEKFGVAALAIGFLGGLLSISQKKRRDDINSIVDGIDIDHIVSEAVPSAEEILGQQMDGGAK